MLKRYNLIVRRAGETIGLIPLDSRKVDKARYIDILQTNEVVETFDRLETGFFFVNANLEVISVRYRDFEGKYMETITLDLSSYFVKKEELTDDIKRYEFLKTLIQNEMDEPEGTIREQERHTEMLKLATSDMKAKQYVISKMTQIILKTELVQEHEVEDLIYRIYGDLYGMGVLQELDDDPQTGEIMVNAVTFPKFHCDIYYIRNGVKRRYDKTFKDLTELKKVFERTVAFDNKELNSGTNSRIESTRPNRDRVNIIIPDASDNWLMNIRKFTNFVPNLDTMRESGTVTPFIADLMSLMVRGKANIGIGGAMGTGKTTFINYLLSYTPAIERKVVIASVAETDVDRVLKGHDVSIFNVNEEKGFSFQELLRTSLRTTADRVIIPESRGGEFKELYEANLKTKGNMFTAHALDDVSFMDACVDMYMSSPDANSSESSEFLRNKLSKAIDLVVIKRKVGSDIRIKSISEVLQDHNGNYAGMNPLIVWDVNPNEPLKGEYRRTNNRISDGLRNRLNEHGVSMEELAAF